MIREFSFVAESAATAVALPKIIQQAPPGDGHSVVVIPGFCAGYHSTYLLRYVLSRCGYTAVDWDQGVNLGPDHLTEQLLTDVINQHSHTQKVSLIGWSLGGLYARAMANLHPEKIRRVFTLGTPVTASHEHNALSMLFDAVSPTKLHQLDQTLLAHSTDALQVPCVNMYSPQDGVVNWRHCVINDSTAVNLQISGSHMGMTHNRQVIEHILHWLPKQ
jgi:pimeloyl-ACP methyl ester carboxylesterase